MAILWISNRDHPVVSCSWRASGGASGNFPLVKGGTQKIGDVREGSIDFAWSKQPGVIADADFARHHTSYVDEERKIELGNGKGEVR
jgi:hypothetical protein